MRQPRGFEKHSAARGEERGESITAARGEGGEGMVVGAHGMVARRTFLANTNVVVHCPSSHGAERRLIQVDGHGVLGPRLLEGDVGCTQLIVRWQAASARDDHLVPSEALRR